LIGFLLTIFAILWRGMKNVFDNQTAMACGTVKPQAWPWENPIWFSKDKIIPLGVLVGVVFTLLYFRPIVSEGGVPGENTVVRQSVFIIMYLIPAFFFVCPFGLLWATSQQTPSDHRREGLTLGLICGVIAILIHNLIDFAIFEPGVWTAFWLLLALLLSIVSAKTPPQPNPINSGLRGLILAAVILAASGVLCFAGIYKPVQAGRQYQAGLRNYERAETYFTAAAKTDILDPNPYFIAAQWNLQQFGAFRHKQDKFLTQSIMLLHQAQNRDPHNYRCDKLISEIFILKAEVDPNNQENWLAAAYQSALQAQHLYPGSDQIAYDLGQLAEKLKQPQKAAQHYQKAVEIEDQYRFQFAQMYPNIPLFSRLGQKQYDYAKNFLNPKNP
jgi:hypothetical protein